MVGLGKVESFCQRQLCEAWRALAWRPDPCAPSRKKRLDVLARAPRLARAGQHEHVGVGIVGEIVERRVHVAMKLRAHRVALFRAVEDHPGDPVLLLDAGWSRSFAAAGIALSLAWHDRCSHPLFAGSGATISPGRDDRAAPISICHARKVAALTAPRNVVLVGASDRPASWAARVWHNLARYGFRRPGLSHQSQPRPRSSASKCYPDLAALPEPPDHLVVLVPAADVIPVLREAAAAGARSATVFSAGFGEASDAAGRARGAASCGDLIAETGLADLRPQLHGQYLRQEPARHAERHARRRRRRPARWRWSGRAAA